MQKAIYRNKLRINQGILDKIWNRQTPKLSIFIKDRRISNQMQIKSFEKNIQSISVRPMGSTIKTKRGLCCLSKLNSISTIF